MAAYKSGKTSVSIAASQSAENAEVIRLCNEYAALRNEPLNAAVKRHLLEALPKSIAELRAEVNPEAA